MAFTCRCPLPSLLSSSPSLSSSSSLSSSLLGAIDMGTNSFKLLIAQPHHPADTFLPLHRRTHKVVLGRRGSGDAPFSISSESLSLAIDSLRGFRELLDIHGVDASNNRCVAASAVREAANGSELVAAARDAAGLDVRVLSGEEEAALAYRSSLHFFPFRLARTLCVDIRGGSTELALGSGGTVLFASSLRLGHATLAEAFAGKSVEDMRDHVRSVIAESGVAESVERLGFDAVVGSSGTIRALEKAASGERRDWRLRRRELSRVVGRLGKEEGYSESKKFIVAGAVLLEEIFKALHVEVMDVSQFGLVEGVVADIMDAADSAIRRRSRQLHVI